MRVVGAELLRVLMTDVHVSQIDEEKAVEALRDQALRKVLFLEVHLPFRAIL